MERKFNKHEISVLREYKKARETEAHGYARRILLANIDLIDVFIAIDYGAEVCL